MNEEIPSRVLVRLLANTERDGSGCLISPYSVKANGYAQIGWWADGRAHMVLAHRAAWIAEHGSITDGMTIDHICKTRRCIEVAHLRELLPFENSRRNNGRDWPLGECSRGHGNEHLVKRGKGRSCRECHREDNRNYRQRKAAV